MATSNECIRICDAANAVGDWLFEWQTLLTGILALVGAIWTVRLIREQISQVERHETDRLVRQHRAKRFLMAHSLSTSARYSERVIADLSVARGMFNEDRRLAGNWIPPIFPSEVIVNLAEFIETSDRSDVNALVGELIGQLQILESRLASLVEDSRVFRVGIKMNIAEYQIQAAKVLQICSALFPYCRTETENVPLELDRGAVLQSLAFRDAGDDDNDYQYIISNFEAVEKPWWPKQHDGRGAA
jgi:hypothetical protein